jgi:hypothetical protein
VRRQRGKGARETGEAGEAKESTLLRSGLQIRAFFGDDRAFHRTHLEADTAINAGREVDPIPIGAFSVFARTKMNTGDRTGIDAIGNAFTGVCDNRMGHS